MDEMEMIEMDNEVDNVVENEEVYVEEEQPQTSFLGISEDWVEPSFWS